MQSPFPVSFYQKKIHLDAEDMSDSALIYFAQNGSYLGPIAGSSPSPVTSAVGFNENATLPFVPGKTYRLRIVNTSAFSAFFFWIDGHDMRIIEVDGVILIFNFRVVLD